MPSTREICRALQDIQFENAFNPYVERCPVYDVPDAPEVRRHYLAEMLDRAADSEVEAIWVGRDLGYRGGRRTGLALTDDMHFADHLQRWGLDVRRPTYGKPVTERTASAIWSILLRVNVPVFLWNVFPLHPFSEGRPFSNRAHSAEERRAGTEILLKLVEYLKPKRLIAIGNDAYNVLSGVISGKIVYKARHPSYGGQAEFMETMGTLYTAQIADREPDLFGGTGLRGNGDAKSVIGATPIVRKESRSYDYGLRPHRGKCS